MVDANVGSARRVRSRDEPGASEVQRKVCVCVCVRVRACMRVCVRACFTHMCASFPFSAPLYHCHEGLRLHRSVEALPTMADCSFRRKSGKSCRDFENDSLWAGLVTSSPRLYCLVLARLPSPCLCVLVRCVVCCCFFFLCVRVRVFVFLCFRCLRACLPPQTTNDSTCLRDSVIYNHVSGLTCYLCRWMCLAAW